MNPGIVEIFKTDVTNHTKGDVILQSLTKRFPEYFVNFDLDDCDKILRVESNDGSVDIPTIIDIVKDHSVEIDLIPE